MSVVVKISAGPCGARSYAYPCALHEPGRALGLRSKHPVDSTAGRTFGCCLSCVIFTSKPHGSATGASRVPHVTFTLSPQASPTRTLYLYTLPTPKCRGATHPQCRVSSVGCGQSWHACWFLRRRRGADRCWPSRARSPCCAAAEPSSCVLQTTLAQVGDPPEWCALGVLPYSFDCCECEIIQSQVLLVGRRPGWQHRLAVC